MGAGSELNSSAVSVSGAGTLTSTVLVLTVENPQVPVAAFDFSANLENCITITSASKHLVT